jgi:hypothetical protein
VLVLSVECLAEVLCEEGMRDKWIHSRTAEIKRGEPLMSLYAEEAEKR